MARFTVLEQYKYMSAYDEDLFEFFTVPDLIDRDITISNILMQAGPFECLYSDPDATQVYIKVWSDANARKWQKMADAWSAADEFNPLENKDLTIHEDIIEDNESSDTRTDNLTQTETPNLTSEQTVSAYDSAAYSPKERITNTGTDTIANTGTQSTAGTEDKSLTRDVREHGNIGVTSLAQLLESYDKALVDWDLVTYITQSFIENFCITIY